MINALIFDMDGVLLDSEPFWRKALREELASLGVTLSEAEAAETMGIRIDQVLEYRMKTHGWTGKTVPQVTESILSRVIAEVEQRAVVLPGVWDCINKANRDGLKIGLATSSPSRLIDAVVKTLKMEDVFEVKKSAEFEQYGKPHPAIYLRTAEALGIAAPQCLAIEDSFNGLLSAKSAQMKCIAVPEDISAHDPRFVIADAKLDSLLDLDEALWFRLTK
ncbi:MAG: hexitol phosphatase HxpB [Bacteroidia bacterium]|nr:hexitol phosphatase HxpB [Bacteroidia bacterium]